MIEKIAAPRPIAGSGSERPPAWTGLTSAEAADRLEKSGPNELAARGERGAIVAFLTHFTNPLIVLLVLASIVSASVGEPTNAAIIIFVILLSVILDYVQERTSGQAAKRLRESVALRATVLRDGVAQDVPARSIVSGDVIRLTVGDLVPADARLVEARDFFVGQAAFTGESFPVEKIAAADLSLPEVPEQTVYLGTNVTSGEATAVVVRTGNATQFGHIARTLAAAPTQTEFERGTHDFSIFVLKVIVTLVLFVLFVNLALRRDVLDSFLFALALAVGLTPGLLPMIVSVTLARGALRLARKKVIVKRLAAIENLGSIDILCTDKTGTLTEGAIVLDRHVDLDGKESERVLFFALLNATHQAGLRNPLDDAILRHTHAALPLYEKIDEVPFDFVRRRLSVALAGEGTHRLVTKGAPEAVLEACRDFEIDGDRRPFDARAVERFQATFTALSAEGYRVLGVAFRDVPADRRKFAAGDETELTFVGFAAFLDPPKQDVASVLRALKRDHVEVRVITGDNEIVTKKICDQVGLEVKGVVTGDELEKTSAEALPAVAARATVFARMNPDQKREIIQALQRSGHVVGYLGDGINDAPSLRAADVGLSVESAVDVAREAADLILLRKSLRVLHEGILEGRRTFGNIMKYVLMGTSSNFGNMFSMAGASLFLPFLPMLPPQILLNNLLYDFSQITIPGDRVDNDYLLKPKKWDVTLIRRYMIWMGLVSSIFDFLMFGVLLWGFKAGPELFRTGWFIESLATQTLVILVIRTRQVPWKSTPSRALATSVLACVAIGTLLPFTPLARLLGFVSPSGALLATIAALVLGYLGAAEVVKRRLYRESTGVNASRPKTI